MRIQGNSLSYFARLLSLLCLALTLMACTGTKSVKNDKLNELQYAYSGAVRWGDFEGAWNLVDPDYKKQHPKTQLDFDRYNQIQVSAYRELGARVDHEKGIAQREIFIGVINKNNLSERSIRYTESWKYDPVAKTWWVDNGLPDFWAGE